jgi:hypothetical protein
MKRYKRVKFEDVEEGLECLALEKGQEIHIGYISKEFPQLPYSYCSNGRYVFAPELQEIVKKLKELNETL